MLDRCFEDAFGVFKRDELDSDPGVGPKKQAIATTMTRILRALLLSMLATGVFAWLLQRWGLWKKPRLSTGTPLEIEADQLPPEEQERLLDELERML